MNEQSADAAIQHDVEQQVIDIHCHPALKTWLFPSHHVYDGVMPVGYDFSENCFVNIPNMQSGNVGVGVSVYYLPEKKIKTEQMKNVLMTLGMAAIKLLCDRLPIIVEDTSSPSASFEQIKNYIAVFENDIAYAVNEIGGPTGNVAIAYGYADLLEKTSDGKTVFLHSIEGAHALGNAPIDAETLLANLEELFDLGVCQITVGHFFENILVSSSGGIPPGLAAQLGYDPTKQVTYANGYNGDLAIQAIDKMLDLGILIDLVHCHEGAKQMIFARNNARGANKRPLLFAHTGVQEVALKHNPGMIPAFAAYLPTWDDIRQIKDCNGLCGVIFMDYWLTGDDDHLPGIAAIIETIISIRDAPDSDGVKGTYDHIAIGSDMDGFTTIPEDLGGDRMMKDLVNAIAAIDGITSDDIDKICFANYMRVLQAGWGKA